MEKFEEGDSAWVTDEEADSDIYNNEDYEENEG